jgi:putative methanogenesis marker protein 6
MMEETRLIAISPDSEITSSALKNRIMRRYTITVKDTCYGVLIEGDGEKLREIVEEVRKEDKNGIFSKLRGFPIADKRICRATRGGPRPGFHQLDMEYRTLPMIREALDAIERGEEVQIPEERKVEVEELIEIINECSDISTK